MNPLHLSMLLMSIMGEIKHGMILTRNIVHVKREYKKLVGLSKSASNYVVLQSIGETYDLNGMTDEFERKINKFGFERINGLILRAN